MVHDKAAATSLDDYVVRYWYRETGLRHAAVRGASTIGFTSIYYYDSALRLSILANDLPFPDADMPIRLAYNPAGQIGTAPPRLAYAAAPTMSFDQAGRMGTVTVFRPVLSSRSGVRS